MNSHHTPCKQASKEASEDNERRSSLIVEYNLDDVVLGLLLLLLLMIYDQHLRPVFPSLMNLHLLPIFYFFSPLRPNQRKLRYLCTQIRLGTLCAFNL